MTSTPPPSPPSAAPSKLSPSARQVLRKVDLIILLVVAAISIVLSVLHIFKLIETPWIEDNFAVFTLLLLSLIGLHLIVSHLTQEDYQEETYRTLLSLASGSNSEQIRTFKDAAEIEGYLAKRMLEARASICDTTWKTQISEGFSAGDRQRAHQYMDTCIAEASNRVAYREIFIFNDVRRIEKLERRISEERAGYSCRYFREDSLVPRLQFVLIDEEEVLFFASSSGSPLMSFRSQKVAAVLRPYFEVAWAAARPIKTGSKINEKELAYIRKLRDGV